MVRGIYTAATGAVIAENTVDVIANNLANTDTTGFKRALLQVQSQDPSEIYRWETNQGGSSTSQLNGISSQSLVGPLGSGAQIQATPTNFQQGTIQVTGNALDFALYGSGFFVLRDANGRLSYTRDGSFVRGPNDLLETENGESVLDQGLQPIVLPPRGKITSDQRGNLNVAGNVFAKLGVFDFRNRSLVSSTAENRYTDNGGGVVPDVTSEVIQSATEKSNADVVESIVSLITAERWFDANMKVIQTEDNANGLAIQNVGRTTTT